MLVVRDQLLKFTAHEFRFRHLVSNAVLGDTVHLHAYSINQTQNMNFKLSMIERLSTDAEGITTCLGLQAEAQIRYEEIVSVLESKIFTHTLFQLIWT